MTRIKLGIIIFFLSPILYSVNLISAAIYSPVLLETSWDEEKGVFKTALSEVSIIPMFVVLLIAVVGIIIIFQELSNHNKNKIEE